jgi:O-acetyl-ADP-ribose deacetylase (regulator of RNase III)
MSFAVFELLEGSVLKEYRFNKLLVKVVQGDITQIAADAIVNAANSRLEHGGGVALAIVRKGGKSIQEESSLYVKRYGPVPTGQVAVTNAGSLKAKYVIHAVGPVYGEENHEQKLANAFRNSLLKAAELNLKSVALPAISTGIYGYPLQECAKILASALFEFSLKESTVNEVIVCLYDEKAYSAFAKIFDEFQKDDQKRHRGV